MTTEGIEAIHLDTHTWGKAARFFQALGFEWEFETDHSGWRPPASTRASRLWWPPPASPRT